MGSPLETFIAKDLRDYFRDPAAAKAEVDRMLAEDLPKLNDQAEKAKAHSKIGVHLRTLGRLNEAAEHLDQALEIIEEHELDYGLLVQALIRRAHLYHWQEKWDRAEALFDQAISLCQEHSRCFGYLDFAYQHYGKCLFDQGKHEDAHEIFEKALQLRLQKNNKFLVKSTALALKVNQSKMQQ